MRRKGYILMILLITAFMIFAASQAFAVNIGGWTIEPVPGPNGLFPVDDTCNGTPCSKFEYLVYGGDVNVSLIDMLMPVCYDDVSGDGIADNDILLVKTDPSSGKLLDPGVGDNANGSFGVSILDARVLKLPYNIMTGNTFRFTFWTTRAKSRNTSVQLKAGNKLYAGILPGPECYTPVPGSVTYKEIRLNPRDPNTIIKLMFSADGTLIGVFDLDGTPIEGVPISTMECSSSGMPGAALTYIPDDVVLRLGTNTCYNYAYSGRLYTRCY